MGLLPFRALKRRERRAPFVLIVGHSVLRFTIMEWLTSVAPGGAFDNSDPEPTAHAVGYLPPLLRSFRRGYDCNKVSCARAGNAMGPGTDPVRLSL